MSAAVRLANRIANRARRVVSEPRASRHARAAGCLHCLLRGSFAAALLILLGAASCALAQAGDPAWGLAPDESGGGYRVGQTGLWVGGYASLEGEVPQSGPALLQLGDLGLLARYELTPQLAFFNETDLEDTVS